MFIFGLNKRRGKCSPSKGFNRKNFILKSSFSIFNRNKPLFSRTTDNCSKISPNIKIVIMYNFSRITQSLSKDANLPLLILDLYHKKEFHQRNVIYLTINI